MTKRLPTPAGRALIPQLLLALSLLIAQSAAQAHVYSHLKSSAPASDFSGTAQQLCSECLSSAPLLSAASSPDAPRIPLYAAVPLAATPAAASRITTSRHYAFRSRAPPQLL
jgi:hypothetical protein